MLSIDIVCPVFREEASIERFHAELMDATEPLARDFRLRYIYVVDPAPPDRSADLLRAIADRQENVTVLVMSRRFGHQAALIAGIDESRGDAVIMLDSDLQHPPSLIPSLVAHWRAGADIVQGLRQDGRKIPFGKRVTSALFYKTFERMTKIDLATGAADYRLLSRKVADIFKSELREQNPFLRGLVNWVGYKVVLVPFTPEARVSGKSNYSLAALILFAMNGICSFSKLPLRICIGMGLTFAALSLIVGAAFLFTYFFIDSVIVPGWASLWALLAFASSINLFFLGILGEYIGLIFDEVKHRPRYLVGNIYGEGAGAQRPSGAPMPSREAIP